MIKSPTQISSSHPLYTTWAQMTSRCRSPKNSAFEHYGGRGIKVCDRWLGKTGFSNFVSDMGDRPAGKTLNRADSDGDYSPENCRWATSVVQVMNRGVHRSSKLGVKGVQRANDKFRARICIAGKCIHLGVFDRLEAASDAYREAADRVIDGELAK